MIQNGKYEDIASMEFKISEENTGGLIFLAFIYVLGGLIIALTLYFVCKAIKRRLRHKHQRKKYRKDQKLLKRKQKF